MKTNDARRTRARPRSGGIYSSAALIAVAVPLMTACGKSIEAAAAAVKGVQHGTTLTSAEPPAFSFVIDPRAQTPDAEIAEVQGRVEVPGLRLTFIRAMP